MPVLEPNTDYPLVEVQLHIRGKWLDSLGRYVFIEFPWAYEYNSSSGDLRILYNCIPEKKVNVKSSKMICLSQSQIYKEMGSGTMRIYYQINSFPFFIPVEEFMTGKKDSIGFYEPDNTGDIKIIYKEAYYSLKNKSLLNFNEEYIREINLGKFKFKDSIVVINHGNNKRNRIIFMV